MMLAEWVAITLLFSSGDREKKRANPPLYPSAHLRLKLCERPGEPCVSLLPSSPRHRRLRVV
jgi:hypothetical protein